ncbi:MAG: aryl-sulfate sulfotransferase [Myxococcales bacterium]|nr:aryl-sulfate sulfotransferase [Myxococcales bacterium]
MAGTARTPLGAAGPWLLPWVLAAACVPPESLELSCELDPANALRALCSVASSRAEPITLTWGPDADPAAHELQLATEHESPVQLLWLRAGESHIVTARTRRGQIQTSVVAGEPPFTIGYAVEGTASVPAVLHKSSCRGSPEIVISDTSGSTLWFQTLDLLGAGSDVAGVRLTSQGTLLAVLTSQSSSAVVELDVRGNVLFEAIQGRDFTAGLHHDATRWGDHVFALFETEQAQDGTTYTLDGYYVLDRSAAVVHEWRLSDHIDLPAPVEPRPQWDFSHANSISVDEDLGVLISFRNLSSIVYVDGDWTLPSAGQPRWWMGGQTAPVPNDFTLFSPSHHEPEFFQQHHAVLPRPDELTMFDNALEGKPSRMLSFALRPNRGEAHLRQAMTLDRHCFVQGAFYRSSTGQAFATCAEVPMAYEYTPDVLEPVWQMRAGCQSQETRNIDRFVPLERLPAVE